MIDIHFVHLVQLLLAQHDDSRHPGSHLHAVGLRSALPAVVTESSGGDSDSKGTGVLTASQYRAAAQKILAALQCRVEIGDREGEGGREHHMRHPELQSLRQSQAQDPDHGPLLPALGLLVLANRSLAALQAVFSLLSARASSSISSGRGGGSGANLECMGMELDSACEQLALAVWRRVRGALDLSTLLSLLLHADHGITDGGRTDVTGDGSIGNGINSSSNSCGLQPWAADVGYILGRVKEHLMQYHHRLLFPLHTPSSCSSSSGGGSSHNSISRSSSAPLPPLLLPALYHLLKSPPHQSQQKILAHPPQPLHSRRAVIFSPDERLYWQQTADKLKQQLQQQAQTCLPTRPQLLSRPLLSPAPLASPSITLTIPILPSLAASNPCSSSSPLRSQQNLLWQQLQVQFPHFPASIPPEQPRGRNTRSRRGQKRKLDSTAEHVTSSAPPPAAVAFSIPCTALVANIKQLLLLGEVTFTSPSTGSAAIPPLCVLYDITAVLHEALMGRTETSSSKTMKGTETGSEVNLAVARCLLVDLVQMAVELAADVYSSYSEAVEGAEGKKKGAVTRRDSDGDRETEEKEVLRVRSSSRCLLSLAVLAWLSACSLQACCGARGTEGADMGATMALTADCVGVMGWLLDKAALLLPPFPSCSSSCCTASTLAENSAHHSQPVLMLVQYFRLHTAAVLSELLVDPGRGQQTQKILLDLLARQLSDPARPLRNRATEVEHGVGGASWFMDQLLPLQEGSTEGEGDSQACSWLEASGLLEVCVSPSQVIAAGCLARALCALMSSKNLAFCELQAGIRQVVAALHPVARKRRSLVLCTVHAALLSWLLESLGPRRTLAPGEARTSDKKEKQEQEQQGTGGVVTVHMLDVLLTLFDALQLTCDLPAVVLLESMCVSAAAVSVSSSLPSSSLPSEAVVMQHPVVSPLDAFSRHNPTLTVLAWCVLAIAREHAFSSSSSSQQPKQSSRHDMLCHWLASSPTVTPSSISTQSQPPQYQHQYQRRQLDIMVMFQILGASVASAAVVTNISGEVQSIDGGSGSKGCLFLSARALANVHTLLTAATQAASHGGAGRKTVLPLVLQSLTVTAAIISRVQADITAQKKPAFLSNPKAGGATSEAITDPWPSFYAMAGEMTSILSTLDLHQQQQRCSTHDLVTLLRQQCPSRSPWFMTCLLNYLALLSYSNSSSLPSKRQHTYSQSIRSGDGLHSHDFRMCLLPEQLRSTIIMPNDSTSNHNYNQNHHNSNGHIHAQSARKERLLPVLDCVDAVVGPCYEHLVVTRLRLELLCRLELPTSHQADPSLEAKFLFPNLIQRTLLCVHALKSKITLCFDPNGFHLLVNVKRNEECRDAATGGGAGVGPRGVFPPVVTELLCWYVDQFLQTQREEGEQKDEVGKSPLDDLLRYICVCFDLMTPSSSSTGPSRDESDSRTWGESDQQHVWFLAQLVCHPSRLQMLLVSLLDKGGQHRQRQRHTAFIVLCCGDLLLSLPADTPGIVFPTLTLCSLCHIITLLAKQAFPSRVRAVLGALSARLAKSWATLAAEDGDGEVEGAVHLTRPPLARSLFNTGLFGNGGRVLDPQRQEGALELLVWRPTSACTSYDTVFAASASAYRVCITISQNKSPGETITLRCHSLSPGSLFDATTTAAPLPVSVDVGVLPGFTSLWRGLLASPLSLSVSLSSSSEQWTREGEEAGVVLWLLEQLYLSLLFGGNRQAMLRQAVVIMSNEVVLGEGDVEAENGIYKDMDKGSRDREGNGKRSSVQTCVYILKSLALQATLPASLPLHGTPNLTSFLTSCPWILYLSVLGEVIFSVPTSSSNSLQGAPLSQQQLACLSDLLKRWLDDSLPDIEVTAVRLRTALQAIHCNHSSVNSTCIDECNESDANCDNDEDASLLLSTLEAEFMHILRFYAFFFALIAERREAAVLLSGTCCEVLFACLLGSLQVLEVMAQSSHQRAVRPSTVPAAHLFDALSHLLEKFNRQLPHLDVASSASCKGRGISSGIESGSVTLREAACSVLRARLLSCPPHHHHQQQQQQQQQQHEEWPWTRSALQCLLGEGLGPGQLEEAGAWHSLGRKRKRETGSGCDSEFVSAWTDTSRGTGDKNVEQVQSLSQRADCVPELPPHLVLSSADRENLHPVGPSGAFVLKKSPAQVLLAVGEEGKKMVVNVKEAVVKEKARDNKCTEDFFSRETWRQSTVFSPGSAVTEWGDKAGGREQVANSCTVGDRDTGRGYRDREQVSIEETGSKKWTSASSIITSKFNIDF